MSTSHTTPTPTPLSPEPTRRRLSERQALTVQRLTQAAVEELRAHGYAGLTVRNVARRAGIAPATAYTYFTSKEHLVVEIFWRRIQALPEATLDGAHPPAARAAQALGDIARVLADEPALAAAITTAILAPGPEVRHLQSLLGAEIHRRLASALGRAIDPDVLMTLEAVLSGAMVRAGTGHATYEELPELLARACDVVLGGAR